MEYLLVGMFGWGSPIGIGAFMVLLGAFLVLFSKFVQNVTSADQKNKSKK